MEHRQVKLENNSGIELSVLEAGQGTPLVFVHGFPDLSIGWHNQITELAAVGYHCLAPDMRGYGVSSCPKAIDAYQIDYLCADLAALLDAKQLDSAYFIGHDWGGFVVWAMAVLYPKHVRGIASLCTPYMPFPSVAKHLALVDGKAERQYVAWFQDATKPQTYMDQHIEQIIRRTFRSAVPLKEIYQHYFHDGALNANPFYHLDKLPPATGELILSEDEVAQYIAAFKQSGFHGGISWYRNIDQNAAKYPSIGTQKLDIPCLMLMAELDPALRPEFCDPMPELCANLDMHLIEGSAHWLQREKADIVNRHILAWLDKNR